jgi:60 kDa SS-A/Ro ribonucleoprotein
MKFTKHWNKKQTAQNQPIPGSGQVRNSAGGFAWEITPWQKLDRFLILGTEGGTFYVTEQKLTVGHAENLVKLLKEDGERVVQRIVEISQAGRAPKNDAAIFGLAMAAAYGETPVRQAAFEAVPKVCRTGTHLFQFVSETEAIRGWGRGMRRAVQNWYNATPVEDLTYQAIKYQQRNGWSHRDLLRLGHPKPASDGHKVLFKWIVDGELTGANAKLEAFEKLKSTANVDEAVRLITDGRMPRECVPTQLLNEKKVWEALLQDMPLTAMVRNLGNMTKIGLLQANSEATRKVVAELTDAERLKRARVHPIALLLAHATYTKGRGMRGKGEWAPVPKVIDALDEAFYKAFEFVQPTNKRYLLGIDVSSSMSHAFVGGTPLSACEAATAMAMVTMQTEEDVTPMAFTTSFKEIPLSRRMRLADALKHTKDRNFGGTDCALPMVYARKKKLEVDVFVVYTDNETWAGSIHPAQALNEYRQATGIPAKLVVMGMCSNGFSIADPRDPGMLDVVGFDTTVPQAMREFVA